MNLIKKILLGVLLVLPCTPMHAQSEADRKLKQLQTERDQALKDAILTASESVNQRYQASLEKLLDLATSEADFDAAIKVKSALNTLPQVVAKQLAGVWALRANTGYAATVTFQSSGTGAHSEYGKFTWRISGKTLYLGLADTADNFQLPIVDGKLKGVNSLGNELTLTQK